MNGRTVGRIQLIARPVAKDGWKLVAMMQGSRGNYRAEGKETADEP